MHFDNILDNSRHSKDEIRLHCPYCHCKALFEDFDDMDDQINHNIKKTRGTKYLEYLCVRICPNCSGICVVFLGGAGPEKKEIVAVWPTANRMGYREAAGDVISNSLDKAIHNFEHGHYDTAAMMLRKAVEQICDREGAPKDKMLGKKLSVLESQVILPPEIIEGMRNLSYLGNDATHVESRTFDQVGKEEVSVGIDLTIEIIRALYHYKTLVQRLKSLKKEPASE